MDIKSKKERNVKDGMISTEFIRTFILALSAFIMLTGLYMFYKAETAYNTSLRLANEYKKPESVCTNCLKDGYNLGLLYFSLAMGFFLLYLFMPRIQNISFGGVTITLRDLQKNIEDLKTQTNDIQQKTVRPIRGKTSVTEPGLLGVDEEPIISAIDPNDPQKGRWGGKSETGDRKMTATVEETKREGWYRVIVTVISTNEHNPLTGLVKFYLHNTFLNPTPVIAVRGGKAVLELENVYGAFTVGAETDDGRTRLELDLVTVKEAPLKFREQ